MNNWISSMLTLMMDKGLLSKEESTATFLGLAWMVLRMATQKTIIHEWTLMTVEMMKNGYSPLSSTCEGDLDPVTSLHF